MARASAAQRIESEPPRVRHPLEGPPATLVQRFFPYGFAVDVSTNSTAVLSLLHSAWGSFTARYEAAAVRCEIVVSETSDRDCPPAPRYHLQLPLLTTICDGDNFSIVDLDRCTVHTHITRATLSFPLFASYFLLSTAYACICTQHATPIHGACVSWNGRGILLCGDSGAGKSSLAYACARQGWLYTSDDASYLMHGDNGRRVTGNSYHVRLRPESVVLFPEIAKFKMTPRAAGKPSVEIPTSALRGVKSLPTADVSYIVYLNRKDHSGEATLLPYSQEAARQSMVSVLYGVPRTLAKQYQAIDRLLTTPLFELRYTTLSDAMQLLRALAKGA